MMRVKNKMKPEIAEEWCSFIEEKVKTNAIYIMRIITKRALEIEKRGIPVLH